MSRYGIDQLRESMVKILSADGQTVSGSGFIIRSDGYLITCHHVICQLAALKVEYQGQVYEAQWCEDLSNSEVDIAILKIEVEGAKAVPIINPPQLSTSVIVYGFPQKKKEYFPEGFDVSAENIHHSSPLKVLATYGSREIRATNPWNKLPGEEASFTSHRVDGHVDSGTSGGPVFAKDLGGVVGVIQSSKNDESYVIRWDNILQSLDKLGLEPEKNAVCEFLQDVADHFQTVQLFHTPEPIILKEQYIPIQVTLERRYKHDVETSWAYAESETELKRAYALKGGEEEPKREKVDWEEARNQHQKLMVLADPGMGKSTLLRMEAGSLAQAERQKLLENQKTINEVIFPLFLRLSELAEKAEEVFDAIPVLVCRDYPRVSTRIIHLLEEKLDKGQCLLLLDALDEVPKEQRRDLAAKLNRFARNYPCPIICTSRIVGYGGAFVDGVKEVEIVPFSQYQTEKYIENWFTNAAGHIDDDSVSAAGLIRELRQKPQIGGLAQNPLLLSLLCSLYQEKGLTLPARRTQVYEKAVDYMLGKWGFDNRRQSADEFWAEAKKELLEELAYQFTCEGKEIFSLRDLRSKTEKYLRSENVPSDLSNLSTSDLLSELSEEDGILQKLAREGDKYLFLHRTFQEYLTASYLNRASDGIALVKEHCWEYDWHETLSLLAGLMEDPVPLLQTITAKKDDIFSTLLLLVGRCLAECQSSSNPLSAEIIDKIYDQWCCYPSAGFIESTLVAVGQAHSRVSESLKEALKDKDSDVRRAAAEALGKIGSPEAVAALIPALQDKRSDVRGSTAEALAQVGSPEAVAALIPALRDEDSDVRGSTAEALAQVGSPEAVAALIPALRDKDSVVRRAAAEALGEIGSPEAVAALNSALQDKGRNVKRAAARALGKIGTLETLEKLIQLPEIDIYDPEIFLLARALAVRFSKEKGKVPFIPVYPELVR